MPSGRTVTEEVVRKIIRARGERSKFLPAHLFGEPAWDMLLDLYLRSILGERVSVSSLCIAANVPATTALRWIDTLKEEGLVDHASDPLDGRRQFVTLSQAGLSCMDSYFEKSLAAKGAGPFMLTDR